MIIPAMIVTLSSRTIWTEHHAGTIVSILAIKWVMISSCTSSSADQIKFSSHLLSNHHKLSFSCCIFPTNLSISRSITTIFPPASSFSHVKPQVVETTLVIRKTLYSKPVYLRVACVSTVKCIFYIRSKSHNFRTHSQVNLTKLGLLNKKSYK